MEEYIYYIVYIIIAAYPLFLVLVISMLVIVFYQRLEGTISFHFFWWILLFKRNYGFCTEPTKKDG